MTAEITDIFRPPSLIALPSETRRYALRRLFARLEAVQIGLEPLAGTGNIPGQEPEPYSPEKLSERFTQTLQLVATIDRRLANPAGGLNHGHQDETAKAFHALIYDLHGQHAAPDQFFDFHRLNEPQRLAAWSAFGVDKRTALRPLIVAPGETRRELYTAFTPLLGITMHIATHQRPAGRARISPTFHLITSYLHFLPVNEAGLKRIFVLTERHLHPSPHRRS